jgi:catechol 2,3-dioxygenase-like lactoylglutathione lyase family enzyme
MRITHIDHYNIRTRPSDLPAIRDFYVNVLGLTEGARPNFAFPGYWLYGGAEAAILHLAATLPEAAEPMSRGKPPGPVDHISLKATGVESAKARLTAAGVTFDARPLPGWNVMQIFFTDPAGVKVELTFDMEREANVR